LEQLHVAEGQLTEAGQDVSRGNALEIRLIGAQTSLLQAKQDALTVGIRHLTCWPNSRTLERIYLGMEEAQEAAAAEAAKTVA
jgi:hypothetical protein